MFRNRSRLAVALMLLPLAGPPADGAAQGRGDRPRPRPNQAPANHPRLRAALHELREARGELREARDDWPPGYRDRALHSIDDAIDSIRAILKVNDVNSFRGIDRNPDYYRRYRDRPRLRAALQDLRDARQELESALANAGDLKERAIDNIDVAIGDILTLVRYNRR